MGSWGYFRGMWGVVPSKAAFQYLPDMKFFSWGQVLKCEVTWVRNAVTEHLGSCLVLQSGKAAEEARHSLSSG